MLRPATLSRFWVLPLASARTINPRAHAHRVVPGVDLRARHERSAGTRAHARVRAADGEPPRSRRLDLAQREARASRPRPRSAARRRRRTSASFGAHPASALSALGEGQGATASQASAAPHVSTEAAQADDGEVPHEGEGRPRNVLDAHRHRHAHEEDARQPRAAAEDARRVAEREAVEKTAAEKAAAEKAAAEKAAAEKTAAEKAAADEAVAVKAAAEKTFDPVPKPADTDSVEAAIVKDSFAQLEKDFQEQKKTIATMAATSQAQIQNFMSQIAALEATNAELVGDNEDLVARVGSLEKTAQEEREKFLEIGLLAKRAAGRRPPRRSTGSSPTSTGISGACTGGARGAGEKARASRRGEQAEQAPSPRG